MAYALSERQTESCFTVAAVIAAIAFAVSVFIAGKGITATRNAGFEGDWNLEAGKHHYNWQAIMLLIGLIAFGVALFRSGEPKSLQDTQREQYRELQGEMESLQSGHEALLDSLRQLRQEFPQDTIRAESETIHSSGSAVR